MGPRLALLGDRRQVPVAVDGGADRRVQPVPLPPSDSYNAARSGGRGKRTYEGLSPESCAKVSAILNSISANLSRLLPVESSNQP